MIPSGSSMIESGFSDHFVVRRQPEKRADYGEDDKSTADSGSKIGDHLRIENAKDIDKEEPKAIRKLLTPFQLGRKSLGSIFFNSKNHNLKDSDRRSDSPHPVPGRPSVISDPVISTRDPTCVLRPFTAIPGGPLAEDNRQLRLTGSNEARNGANTEEVKSAPTFIKANGPSIKSSASVRRHPFGYYSKTSNMSNSQMKGSGYGRGTQAQQKPNVYRNPTYASSTYIPLVPGPITETSEDLTAANNTSRCEIPREEPPFGPPPQTASVPFLRPKTANVSGYPYGAKPDVRAPASSALLVSRRGPKPGVAHPFLSSSVGDGAKSVVSTSFRTQVTSPLSPNYPPIRPYVCSKDDENNIRMPNELGVPSKHSLFTTCCQREAIPLYLLFENLLNIRKVGEGVYGEVFKAFFRGFPDQRVYKIVPIEGSKIVNGEKQKRFEEVEPEIIVSQELNKLRAGYNGCYTDGHSKLLHARVCQGKYPEILVEQWKAWHRAYVSQNDLPEFDHAQLYAVFEFEYHGTDIECYKFRNARQSLAVYLHVLHALAAAEAALEFEHRDLHWGNILVVKTREPCTTYNIQGITYRVPNCGLKSTVIDYTISRLTKSSTGEPVFTDLADDEDQFCGSEDYQFEIYRMMREENKNNWSTFCPKSNIFWAHYLIGKLIDKGRYTDVESPTHHVFRNKLCRIQNNILKYSSCMECVRRYLPPFCRDLDSSMF